MTIAFIHPHRSILPELDAYRAFFHARGIVTEVLDSRDAVKTKAPVEWHLLGTHKKRNLSKIVIHEYASVSVPPFSPAKDFLKKKLNAPPDFRIFNSDFVKEKFAFDDGVPFGIRNYGILSNPGVSSDLLKKKYDFIYVGSVEKIRKLSRLFDCFTHGALEEKNLLVLSRDYKDVFDLLGHPNNIQFKGPVTQQEVYDHIRRSRFGINFMPDLFPFNRQTSAKFIDYAACGIPIITTDYSWVRDFQKKEGGNYFYLKKDLSNFTWKELNEFPYAFPDLHTWTWEHQIRKSGVLDFLSSKFTGLNW